MTEVNIQSILNDLLAKYRFTNAKLLHLYQEKVYVLF